MQRPSDLGVRRPFATLDHLSLITYHLSSTWRVVQVEWRIALVTTSSRCTTLLTMDSTRSKLSLTQIENYYLCRKFGSLLVVPAGWDALSLKWCSNPGIWSSLRRVNQSNWLISARFTAIASARLNSMSPLPRTPKKAVAAAKEAFGRIDVVVNNAGYGFIGAFEEMTADQFKDQIDTNLWGVVHVTRAVLPVLREQGHGHIIQITSVGGRLGVPGLSGYHAAKFAVEGLSEALAQEIKPLGLKLTIVEPGGFRTDWAGASMAFAKPMKAYAPVMDAIRGFTTQHTGHEQGDPRKAGQAIIRLTEMEQPPLRLPLGKDAIVFLRNSYKTSSDALERWADITGSTDFDDVTASPEQHPALQLLETFKA
jgi:NAD(P)-dependent dehydrogenase (short-subunit alcohol dehydrogenase family)